MDSSVRWFFGLISPFLFGKKLSRGFLHLVLYKAVNRGDKRSRRFRDRDFAKFERSRRYRDCYRCQEKKSRRGRDRYLVFRDPPPPRTRARSLIVNR